MRLINTIKLSLVLIGCISTQVASKDYFIENKLCKKILILDLDVHQWNGTASIFKGIKNVFTLSFHGKNNYPFKKEDSDFDLALEDGVGDEYYLRKVKEILPRVIDDFEPDFVFYLSGVDIMENDKLGKLSLTLNGCKERDKYVLNLCKTNSIPVQVSMGGGYSLELKNIIEALSNSFRLAQEILF